MSTSSRTTEAGRSTTSPAAIWLISSSGSSRIGRRGAGGTGRRSRRGCRCARPGIARQGAPADTAAPDNRAPWKSSHFLVDFILHVDKHLEAFVVAYGAWVYALLFLIVFVETGVVVMPFLPGDSLLFIVGALCGAGLMSYPLAVRACCSRRRSWATSATTRIGRYFGPKVFQWENSRFFNKRAFDQAHAFYERYGGVTIILARFMPFIRTFAPFVAGVADMTAASSRSSTSSARCCGCWASAPPATSSATCRSCASIWTRSSGP